jgi:hypothetical protein
MREAALLDRGKGLNCAELQQLYIEQHRSIYQIAGILQCSPATVSRWLKKCGIETRPIGGDVFEYPKADFSGNWGEKAYLLGFRAGDLHVERGERAVRVRCTSTRPEQIRLIEKLFAPYGGIWKSQDREKRGVGITAHLNLSFDFLVLREDNIPAWVLENDSLFAAYFAGYLDAEGSFILSGTRMIFKVDSCDRNILHQAWTKLNALNISFPLPRLVRPANTWASGHTSTCDLWRLATESKTLLLKLDDLLGSHLQHEKRKKDLKNLISRIQKTTTEGQIQ